MSWTSNANLVGNFGWCQNTNFGIVVVTHSETKKFGISEVPGGSVLLVRTPCQRVVGPMSEIFAKIKNYHGTFG